MEVWKDIKGYEGLYQVSNLGNVMSLHYRGTKNKKQLLKPAKDKDGYLSIALYKDGKTKQYRVHRLVASAFIPNPNNYSQVNHINEIKDDNRVENLEWCTAKYNNNYGDRRKHASQSQLGEKNHRYGKPAWNKGMNKEQQQEYRKRKGAIE